MQSIYEKYWDRLPSGCERIYRDYENLFLEAPGSSFNHQNWRGGYLDHSADLFRLVEILYPVYNNLYLESLDFKIESALLVVFLHDIEKPFKYSDSDDPIIKSMRKRAKEDSDAFKKELVHRYGIELSAEEKNALKYVHGEGDDYRKDERIMNSLAAFCHVCDISSARIWYDHSLSEENQSRKF